ncbi:immunoglobulin-like domain-containing protein [uncultured Duncaniella sp.]|nr:immunoglobulin-like domain-containing protein [uncultured Duncaniella sp.]
MMSCTLSNDTSSATSFNTVASDSVIVDEPCMDSIGIFMMVETIDLPKGNLVISIKNNTDSIYSTGDYYKVEQYEKGEWIYLPYKPVVFYGKGYEITPGSSRQFKINLSDLDGVFDKGKYKITKNIICNYKHETISTEFSLGECP